MPSFSKWLRFIPAPFFMWFPAPEILARSHPATAFLVCRWEEFFARSTPDTFRPRVCNIPVLLSEIAEVARMAEEQDGLRRHLRNIQQECRAALSVERDFYKVCSSEDQASLETIAAEATDFTTATRLGRRLLDGGFTSRYEEAALRLGAQAFSAQAPLGKRSSDRWLGLWATIALHRKYSVAALSRESLEMLITRTPADAAAELVAAISRRETDFVCVVPLKPQQGDVEEILNQLKGSAAAAGVDLAHHSWIPEREGDVAGELLVTARVPGFTPAHALQRFVRQLRPFLNVLGFYRGAPVTAPIAYGWAGTDTKDLKRHDVTDLEALDLHPRKNALRLTKGVLRALKGQHFSSSVVNALELHNMAISSPDLRVRFVTMWSALECLAASSEGDTVIKRVSNLLVPIITWRRLEKTIRYLGLNLCEWRRSNGTARTGLASLPDATEFEIPPENVILAVTRPRDHPHILELLTAASPHALLLWRVNETWSLFHNARSLANDFTVARERLEWHLGRIYRVRNRLAHAGSDSSLLRPLLENLQFYLSTAISRILNRQGTAVGSAPADAARHWAEHSDRVLTALRTSPDQLTIRDLISRTRLHSHQKPWTDRPA